MSTQHPDNVTPPPFADADGVLKGDGEILEAMEVFSLGCDEQMWDSEGKEVDNQVVKKMLTGYPDFFREHHLGVDSMLTLRVPNPSIELDMRKSMVEALESIPSARDVAKEFYGGEAEAPIQEVILPFTTSAEELSFIEAYYRKFVVGKESEPLLNGRLVKDWVGEFYPKTVRVIPLIEDVEHMLTSDLIVEEYLKDKDLAYQRVFLARSDPALNYGMVAAELMLKVGLFRLHKLEGRLGIPLYPIVGVGAVPFRGHLSPVNVDRVLREYPSTQTFTIQSAFKYDYEQAVVKLGIQQLLNHQRQEPTAINEERARAIIEKCTKEYQAQVRRLAPVIASVAVQVPKRRERKLHVGLFGYGRTLEGSADVALPRAIGFCAALYSIGVPPELLGLTALDGDDLAFVREVYPSFDGDMREALRFTNERHVKELLGDEYLRLAGRFADGVDRIHEGLTSAVMAGIGQGGSDYHINHYVEEAAHLRRFLG
jgi:phosphoenolpyruvate carboxylase